MEAALGHSTGQFTWPVAPIGAKRSPNEVPNSPLSRAQFSESKYTFLHLVIGFSLPPSPSWLSSSALICASTGTVAWS